MKIKPWAFILIGSAISFALIVLFFLTVVEKVAIKNIVEKEQALLEHQAELMASNLSHGDIEQVKNWATLTAELKDYKSAYVVSNDRSIVASNTIAEEDKPLLEIDSIAFNFLNTDANYLLTNDFLLISAPVLEKGNKESSHFLIIQKYIYPELHNFSLQVQYTALISTIIFLVFSTAYIVMMRTGYIQRIKLFCAAITRFNDGNTEARVKEEKDIFYTLACTLNDSFAFNEHLNKLLQEKESLANLISDLTPDAVIETNEQGTITNINQSGLALFGYDSKDELKGRNIAIFIPIKYQKSHHEAFVKSQKLESVLKKIRNVEAMRRDGSVFPVEIIISRYETAKEKHFLAFIRDRSKAHADKKAIEHLAYHDQLTGLLNPNGIKQQLKNAHFPMQMTVIELLYLRDINDIHGHHIGDGYLQRFSAACKEIELENALIAYLGTSRFLICHNAGGKEEIKQMRSLINKELIIENMVLKAKFNRCVSSLGSIDHFDSIVEQCELSLRSADGEVNKVVKINPEFHKNMKRETTLKRELMSALENGGLYFQYQPKFDANTLKVKSAEALIRWTLDSEFISPGEFIPIAEKKGLMPLVDRYVIHYVCKQIRDWINQGKPIVPISINLSARYLFEQTTIAYIFEKVGEFDIPHNYLEIEVTEYGLIKDYKKTAINMMRLEQAGIEVAIDDYGTGNANLETVLSLPIKHLKIDQSFIKLGMKTEKGKVVLENIFSLAKSLKVKTTAEGVENQEQLDYVKEAQCDDVQGFLLSRPLLTEDFEKLLNDPKKSIARTLQH